MKKFFPKEFEAKWQEKWEKAGLYKANSPEGATSREKYYILDMFPYPSGDGLHVGHFKGYTATDAISRYLRMNGYNVLHPMGWDAFGLPAENYAIKTGIHPKITTAKNVAHIKMQMKSVGLSYDWSREIDTTDPNYYKWTQWIFLQLYKKGLAYQAEAPINWCPKDKTGLANEEVVNGCCDRCGTKVVRKNVRQWILAITKYADRLLNELNGLDWPEAIVEMQKNWIGRSEGALIRFTVDSLQSTVKAKSVNRELTTDNCIEVFTTRADTLFGATYMVIAPEHPIVASLLSNKQQVISKKLQEIKSYVEKSSHKSDLERTDLAKQKTGVSTGLYAVNPINDEKIPIWISDYVLASYGTGAIMAVPAHDERDWEFAKKFNLPIKHVIKPEKSEIDAHGEVFVEYGTLINSAKYNGLHSKEAIATIIADLKKVELATLTVQYRLRDWIFSRQRYWGEPIPIVYCANCWEAKSKKLKVKSIEGRDFVVINGEEVAIVPLDEKDLPLLLPEVEKYEPTGTGESPLAAIKEWVNTTCPQCGGPAKRETNTMPQWAGSCWYYLRFLDPKNSKKIVELELEKYWMGKSKTNAKGGVDWYVGGAEHAVLHLLYARFWHKLLFDIGIVSTSEPFYKLRNVGLIMGPDGQKMSKSRGNVISPEEMINDYGADTLRVFEMFVGPFDSVADWNPKGVEGVYRFLKKVWNLSLEVIDLRRPESSQDVRREIAKLNKKVASDIMEMKFNTSVAAAMEFVNFAQRHKEEIGVDVLGDFLKILAPFAPHMTEELWQELFANSKSQTLNSKFESIHSQAWPEFDEKYIRAEMVTVVVQVNGKVRERLLVEAGIDQEKVEKLALESAKVQKYVGGKKPQKVIYVPGKLINFVV